MEQKKIGSFIAANRKKKSLTQGMLGEKLGVTKDTIKKGICVAVGLSLICIGWYFRNILDRIIFGN